MITEMIMYVLIYLEKTHEKNRLVPISHARN